MQIVIDIDDEIYNEICQGEDIVLQMGSIELKDTWASDIIRKGTPLPKGHGRLCDLDAALKCMEEVADDKSNIKECAMGFFDWACSKRVVLEADKEVENDERRSDKRIKNPKRRLLGR